MHPLHSILFADQKDNEELHAVLTADPRRSTGRSTVLALTLITRAIKTPGTRIYIEDHHYSDRANEHLVRMIQRYLDNMAFQGFTFGKSVIGFYMVFGDVKGNGKNGK